jgi:O-antigen/teichoic acid export membrane protein
VQFINRTKSISTGFAGRTFSLALFATTIKILSGFASTKYIAIVTGSEGIALLGQLNNFNTIVFTLGSAGINFGVTKYIAEHADNPGTMQKYLRAGLSITLVASLCCGLLIIAFKSTLAQTILLDEKYSIVFLMLAFSVAFFCVGNYFNSVLSGLQDVRRHTFSSVSNSIVALVFSVVLVYLFQAEGALIGAVTYPVVGLFALLLIMRNSTWLRLCNFKGTVSAQVLQHYGRYSIMALITAATVPLSQLLVRHLIIQKLGIDQAGLWEGANRLSSTYLMVVTSVISLNYLPRMAAAQTREAVRAELKRGFLMLLGPLLVGFVAIYFLREFLITLAFSPEFLPMKSILGWQLLIDVVRITTYLFSFVWIAKAHTSLFIITELMTYSVFTGLAYIMVEGHGLVGVMQANILAYLCVLIFLAFAFRRRYS